MTPKPARKSTADPKERKLDGKKAMKARASTTRKQPTRGAKSKTKKPASKASQMKTPTKKNLKTKANVKKKEEDSPQPNPVPATTTEELPHNLGNLTPITNSPQPPNTLADGNEPTSVATGLDEPSHNLHLTPELTPTTGTSPQTPASQTPKPKPEKNRPKYKITPGKTPFPSWPAPTPTQCEELNQLLSYAHGEPIAPKTIPRPSIEFAGCGEVPCVLDALIRTLLSAATQGSNSAMSYKALASRFGVLEDGVGKGGVNWDAVRLAPLREVFETIQRGGLADVKSKNLKGILDLVYEENRVRFEGLRGEERQGGKNEEDSNDIATLIEPEAKTEMQKSKSKSDKEKDKDREYDLACAEQNFLTLNHLHNLPTTEAMEELIKYPGIGVKTAACVLLFCLQRPCFAVDTHIFRITKWLGWVPADLATEVTAFSHLDARIPDHLKYSLHHLLIKHGKLCPHAGRSRG
ncbi:hypothetical protein N7509_013443 [Penicillium cosmopolitanum]|uniref:HhH-GPD domain-containing protein n=1 Tax=Penicillium cosmopolitanum TaxID=1131564 RepID=A0A9W9VC49_9EURO|nr:uncharacterized protein N7509_013443 [Penicillium cosmopolitanum]KAJ5376557.1 hypothetical protein N7509_013443 [Penicillium cosmopolitanum]